MIYLTRSYSFSASHRLHSPSLGEDENRRVYGKCANPYGHGHNYRLEVTLAGPVDAATGMLVDLGALDRFVAEEILEAFDHKNLNLVERFAGQVPTSETLCKAIYEIFEGKFRLATVERVRLEETTLNSFEYPANGRR